jgi:hypothetical protein
VRDLTNELEFTAEEISACNIRMKDGLILWDIERDKDVEVNEVVEHLIKNKLKELNSSNKLPIEYNLLFEKFKLN